MVEVNHKPTSCEPHYITPQYIIDYLNPNFDIGLIKVYKPIEGGGLWESIEKGLLFESPLESSDVGWLFGSFNKL